MIVKEDQATKYKIQISFKGIWPLIVVDSWLLMTYQSMVQLNGLSCHTVTFRFVHFSGSFLYPKRPFCSPTFANCIEKDLHAPYLTNVSIMQLYFRFMDFVPFANYSFVTVWHVTFDSIFWINGFWHGYQSLSHIWILLLVCEKVILNEVQAEMDLK